MLDIKVIRKNPNIIIDVLKKRYEDDKIILVKELIEKDKRCQEIEKKVMELRHKRNVITHEIRELKIKGDKLILEKKLKEASEIPKVLAKIEQEYRTLKQRINQILMLLPNFIDKEVPIGNEESSNIIIYYKGIPKVMPKFEDRFKASHNVKYKVCKDIIHHADIVKKYNLVDTEKAAMTSGARFYYELDELVLLDIGMTNYLIEKFYSKGYRLIVPPYMVRRWVEENSSNLEIFEEMLYKVENENLYLIPTAEHPLAAYFANKRLKSTELPIKMCGFSTCFRKEAGSHGKDTKGIFRTHQFNKVEQFAITHPNDSEMILREFGDNCEEILNDLNIPFRKVLLCSGEMDKKVTKQFDFEAWFPGQNKYREVMSIGNVKDWQCRRLNIKIKDKPGDKPVLAHSVYATGAAIQRTILAMLENNIDGNTIKIPKVLHKYVPFKELKVKN